MAKKVVFCIPTWHSPSPTVKLHTNDALEESVPLIEAAGWEHALVYECGNAYISAARATMTRKALDAKSDVIVYLDHDLSWDPQDLVTLLETSGDVVGGTYRFKGDVENEEYMGMWDTLPDGRPACRQDGCIKMRTLPAGFLKVTKEAVNKFMTDYPELCYGEKYHLSVDLFNHGAYGGLWWGEDYAFCRRWNEKGGSIWCLPKLNITHWAGNVPYEGNLDAYLHREFDKETVCQ